MTWATLRRLVMLVATLALLLALAQTAPLDLALFAAGDIVGYLELAALVWLAAAQGHARGVLRQASMLARPGARKLAAAVELRTPRRAAEPAAANDNWPDNDGLAVGAVFKHLN